MNKHLEASPDFELSNSVRDEPRWFSTARAADDAPHETRVSLSLTGDPAFSRNNLSAEQRMWYDRFWAGVARGQTNNNPTYDVNAGASSDDLFSFRGVSKHVDVLMLALRATGDLAILDEIDRIVQMMRRDLRDGNCDGSGKDGYLNWRWRKDSNWVNYCTGWHRMDATITHAFLAEVAYAFEVNRNLASPGGVNYAERADFWKDYLKNHFEPSWRARDKKPWPNQFMMNSGLHPDVDFIRYYYFMHKLTGLSGYSDLFKKLTNNYLNTPRVQGEEAGGFQMMPTPWGNAALWSQSAPARGAWGTRTDGRNSTDGQAFVYYRSSIMSPASLTLEGASGWATSGLMEAIGVSTALYVMDTDDVSQPSPFASGISGSTVVTHPTEGWSFAVNTQSRGYVTRFASSAYAVPLAFMSPGPARDRFKKITVDAYNVFTGSSNRENPRDPSIPAFMLLDAMK